MNQYGNNNRKGMVKLKQEVLPTRDAVSSNLKAVADLSYVP